MSDHNQKVEPLRFEPAAPPAPEADRAAGAVGLLKNRNWVIPALSLLAIIAVLVFVWLPQQVDSEAVEIAAAKATPVRPGAPVSGVSPWSEAQLARQRKAAQAVLAELLDQQFALEELHVEEWAAEASAAARAFATKGDELYRRQQFIEAAASYQRGLDAMLALKGQVDTVFRQQFEKGLEALAEDRAAAAVRALELATILRPDLPEPQVALARARNLAPLLDILARAKAVLEQGDPDAALTLLQQALALDPQHSGAKARLQTVRQDIARRDFKHSMTAGYQALDAGAWDAAEREFMRARKIMPGATEADSALQQTRTARTQQQIEAFATRAGAAQSREDWERAVAAWREILAIDDSVVLARAGLIRAQTRAELDKNLRAAIASPERLSDEAVYNNSRRLYRQALGLKQQGPLLRDQLRQLDELLRLAVIPIPVLLQSDELTDVTVYKVAHLGSFKRRQLELKPGTYTAVGVRSGYRDVRLQFKVAPAADSVVVEITCREAI